MLPARALQRVGTNAARIHRDADQPETDGDPATDTHGLLEEENGQGRNEGRRDEGDGRSFGDAQAMEAEDEEQARSEHGYTAGELQRRPLRAQRRETPARRQDKRHRRKGGIA